MFIPISAHSANLVPLDVSLCKQYDSVSSVQISNTYRLLRHAKIDVVLSDARRDMSLLSLRLELAPLSVSYLNMYRRHT